MNNTLKRLEKIEAELAAADDADMPYFRIESYVIEPDGTLKREPNPDGTPCDDQPAKRVIRVVWTPSDGNGKPAPCVVAYLRRRGGGRHESGKGLGPIRHDPDGRGQLGNG